MPVKYTSHSPPVPEIPHLIETKKGRLLNLNLLGDSEVKRVREERRIQPLTLDEGQWDAQLAKGKFAYAYEGKTILFEKENSSGAFQGAFQTRDGRILAFRSSSRFSSLHLKAFELTTCNDASVQLSHQVAGQQARESSTNLAIFELKSEQKVAGITNRKIKVGGFKGHGIATVAFDQLERSAAAKGIPVMTLETRREDLLQLGLDRGYVLQERKGLLGETILEKKLTKKPPEHDMTQFHRFPVLRNGKKVVVVVPIDRTTTKR